MPFQKLPTQQTLITPAPGQHNRSQSELIFGNAIDCKMHSLVFNSFIKISVVHILQQLVYGAVLKLHAADQIISIVDAGFLYGRACPDIRNWEISFKGFIVTLQPGFEPGKILLTIPVAIRGYLYCAHIAKFCAHYLQRNWRILVFGENLLQFLRHSLYPSAISIRQFIKYISRVSLWFFAGYDIDDEVEEDINSRVEWRVGPHIDDTIAFAFGGADVGEFGLIPAHCQYVYILYNDHL